MKRTPKDILRLVLEEKKKNPCLSTRKFSAFLKKTHDITLSKSAISKIFKSRGIETPSLSPHKIKEIKECGLILLECLDSQIGLFNHIAQSLKSHFPRMTETDIKKTLISAAFSAMSGQPPQKILKNQEVLTVDMWTVKDNLRLVSTIEFNFNNGYVGYCDAKMSTIWDRPCDIQSFFSPLGAASRQIERMLNDKVLTVGCTKSFGSISKLVFDFFKGAASGITAVRFLNAKGEPLNEIKTSLPKISFLIGYYPKIITKGFVVPNKPAKYQGFFWQELGEFFCSNNLTEFSQPIVKEKLILNNVRIKANPVRAPIWGILANLNIAEGGKESLLNKIVKKYLYLRPYPEESFLKEMKIIEKALFASEEKKDYTTGIIPKKLTFSRDLDFSRPGLILSILFKEMIAGWEPKGRKGQLSTGKDYLGILLKQAPKKVKKAFNQAGLYLDSKRAFII